MNKLRVVVADDHPVVRAGLAGMLASQTDFEVVGEAADGLEAVELAVRLQPDVIVMDLRMAKMDGAEAIVRIRQLSLRIPILVLTTYDSNADILRAIEVGATGYMLKDAPRDHLFAAIRTVAQGKSVFAPEVATRLLRHLQCLPGRSSASANKKSWRWWRVGPAIRRPRAACISARPRSSHTSSASSASSG